MAYAAEQLAEIIKMGAMEGAAWAQHVWDTWPNEHPPSTPPDPWREGDALEQVEEEYRLPDGGRVRFDDAPTWVAPVFRRLVNAAFAERWRALDRADRLPERRGGKRRGPDLADAVRKLTR